MKSVLYIVGFIFLITAAIHVFTGNDVLRVLNFIAATVVFIYADMRE